VPELPFLAAEENRNTLRQMALQATELEEQIRQLQAAQTQLAAKAKAIAAAEVALASARSSPSPPPAKAAMHTGRDLPEGVASAASAVSVSDSDDEEVVYTGRDLPERVPPASYLDAAAPRILWADVTDEERDDDLEVPWFLEPQYDSVPSYLRFEIALPRYQANFEPYTNREGKYVGTYLKSRVASQSVNKGWRLDEIKRLWHQTLCAFSPLPNRRLVALGPFSQHGRVRPDDGTDLAAPEGSFPMALHQAAVLQSLGSSFRTCGPWCLLQHQEHQAHSVISRAA
jgi:hypothetical protein